MTVHYAARSLKVCSEMHTGTEVWIINVCDADIFFNWYSQCDDRNGLFNQVGTSVG